MAARRQWAGTTPEERRATRRRALLDAGIAALGAIDGPALTIRTVCRSSGVSERNFYEEFGDRDDFVRAVYQDVLESVMRVVTDSQPKATIWRPARSRPSSGQPSITRSTDAS